LIDKENRGGDHKTKQRDRFYVASVAREHTEDSINLLVDTINDKTLKRSDRIKAAEILIERGWGKAPQEIRMGNIEGEEGVKFVVEIVDTKADGSAGKVAGTDHQDLGAQRDDHAASGEGIPSADSPAAAGGA
jgi:hypothetical protein